MEVFHLSLKDLSKFFLSFDNEYSLWSFEDTALNVLPPESWARSSDTILSEYISIPIFSRVVLRPVTGMQDVNTEIQLIFPSVRKFHPLELH
ncbi:hypothetical protein Enr17x_13880 [Gimesia fumaroli]|uniref:Uncharacterized protein n=1 Tax=Gimesia fumaroli TaxID=2527976 RepID=A0A518I8E4_9PLAN|nr:hypothetical protein Enr17x_13880 [Gimesia fumaroli]